MEKTTYRFGQVHDEPVADKPICVRFPRSIDEWLRRQPDRSEVIRAAVELYRSKATA